MFDSLIDWFWQLIYSVTALFTYIMEYLYEAFQMIAGLTNITYDGKSYTLIEAFFGSSTLTKFYWHMAIIGVSLTFFFTILAVVKKMFDSSDKVKQSLGGILGQGMKSILLILGLNLLMTCIIYFSTEFIRIVSISFEASYTTDGVTNDKTFTESEYAQMANILNTIGNYSLNPSYNSRYNLNSCYNAIRGELAELDEEGVFSIQYVTPDPQTGREHYWQETLQKIINAAPDKGETEIKLDVYNKDLSDAIMNAMDQIQNNNGFIPLDKYRQETEGIDPIMRMDRLILLMGTLESARNNAYNGKDAAIDDALRAPYYYGYAGNDVHDASSMGKTFYLNTEYKYVMVWFLMVVITKALLVIIFNCIARIFNMAILYIAAPPIIAASPYDDGGKLKQWTTAFIVQTFGVLGTILGMYILLIFVPFVMNSKMVFFEDSTANTFIKFIIIWGGFETAKKASGMITGILADSAGWQSVQAGDMSGAPRAFSGAMKSIGSKVGVTQLARMQRENIAKKIQGRLLFSGGNENGRGKGGSEKSEEASDGGTLVSTPDGGGGGDLSGSESSSWGGGSSSGGGRGNSGPQNQNRGQSGEAGAQSRSEIQNQVGVQRQSAAQGDNSPAVNTQNAERNQSTGSTANRVNPQNTESPLSGVQSRPRRNAVVTRNPNNGQSGEAGVQNQSEVQSNSGGVNAGSDASGSNGRNSSGSENGLAGNEPQNQNRGQSSESRAQSRSEMQNQAGVQRQSAAQDRNSSAVNTQSAINAQRSANTRSSSGAQAQSTESPSSSVRTRPRSNAVVTRKAPPKREQAPGKRSKK